MNAREEIDVVKSRVGALERELAQLKRQLELLDDAISAPPVPRKFEQSLAVESMQSEAKEHPRAEPPPALPPPLPSAPVIPHRVEAIPVPAPVTVPALPREPLPPQPNPLREWLEPLQLWPPSGEENAEVRLAAWWATRVGALLAVIGIVFLGLYVSRGAPPWMRLAEVSVVTAGVLGLGYWLERKLPKFGAVLFGGGLALVYFCAFAAYAVPPMKVITSPAVATLAGVVAVAGILGVAWWRNSIVVASMAVALGYVTAFLALREGPANFGPWVVLLLGGAAVVLRLARGWDAPSMLAMPLTWLFLGVASIARGPGHDMAVHAVWVWTGLHLALFMVRDWVVAWRGGALGTTDRALQVTNSSLAVAVGLMAALRAGGTTATQFYFGSGVIMLLAAWTWRAVRVDALVPILVCKGSGLVALGVIDAFAGQARYLVLLAQAFVMLVSARHSHQRWLRTATVVAGALSLAFFLFEVGRESLPFWTQTTALEVCFLAGALAFVAALERWVEFGKGSAVVASVIVGVATIWAVSHRQMDGWAPAIEVGLAAILVCTAAVVRGWFPAAVAAGFVIVAGHVEMWMFVPAAHPRVTLWWNEVALLLAAFAAVPAIARLDGEEGKRNLRLATAALATGTLVAVCFKGLAPAVALTASTGLAVLLVGAALAATAWPLAVLAAPVVTLAGVFYLRGKGEGASPWFWVATVAAWIPPLWLTLSRPRLESIGDPDWRRSASVWHTALATAITLLALWKNLHGEPRIVAAMLAASVALAMAWRAGLRPALEASWVLWSGTLLLVAATGASIVSWTVALVCWLPAIALARVSTFQSLRSTPPGWRAHADVVQVVLATVAGGIVAMDCQGSQRFLAFGVVVGTAVAVWRWARVAAARPAALVLAGVVWVYGLQFVTAGRAEGWGAGLAAVLVTAAALALLPFVLGADLNPAVRRRLRWLTAAAALVLAFMTFLNQRGEVSSYATVGWGVSAAGVFLAGLVARSRPHRLCGLAGLALCVPRVFIVDLHSTLYRIAAFVALGVVLLWVGFSYHRFRHLIGNEEKKL